LPKPLSDKILATTLPVLILLMIIIILVVGSMGTVEEATLSFLAELGHRITALSGDSRKLSFLFQRVSVLVQ